MDSVRDELAPGLDHRCLHVGIIGAGIGGLTAGIALARSGHQVEIYERSMFANEIGAAIIATPNCSRALEFYGFDFESSGATEIEELQFIEGKTLEVKQRVPCKAIASNYGAKWYALHRVDFHDQLKSLALGYPTLKLHLDAKVEKTETCGKLCLQGGQTIQKDLIVIADGIKSEFAHLVAGHPVNNEAAGQLVFRFLIDTEKILGNPTTRPLYEENPGNKMLLAAHEELKLTAYPCRSGQLQNFALFHDDDLPFDSNGRVWDIEATMDDFRKHSQRLHPSLESICKHADEVQQWRLLRRNRLIENLVKDHAVVIGDAAHPLLPFQGQGAGMAIEDAAALGVFFSHFTARDSITARLKLFQTLRKDRVCAMQIFSRLQPDNASMEEARKYVQGELPKSPADYNEYALRFDVIREAMGMLKEHIKGVL